MTLELQTAGAQERPKRKARPEGAADLFWATISDTPKAFAVVLLGFVAIPCIMIAAVPLLALAVVWFLIRLALAGCH